MLAVASIGIPTVARWVDYASEISMDPTLPRYRHWYKQCKRSFHQVGNSNKSACIFQYVVHWTWVHLKMTLGNLRRKTSQTILSNVRSSFKDI